MNLGGSEKKICEKKICEKKGELKWSLVGGLMGVGGMGMLLASGVDLKGDRGWRVWVSV